MLKTMKKQKLKIFTWHIHGSYLYYLTQANCEFFLPVRNGKPAGYAGKTPGFPWGANVHEVPAEKVKDINLDIILYQSNYGSKNSYLEDRYEILSEEQRELPSIYLEHEPPREHPTDTKHILDNPNILLVHVTNFNKLMWDNGDTPTKVIDHGVSVLENISYSGEIEKGIVVINGLAKRGRRLGFDIFKEVKEKIPLDVVGSESEAIGGLGEISHDKLPAFISDYRFFFSPIRYSSLGLSILEAMAIGMPIVGLATTELTTVIENGISGYVDTNVDHLVSKMKLLLEDKMQADVLGYGAKITSKKRFGIRRFTEEWEQTFKQVYNQNFKRIKQSSSYEYFITGGAVL
jgi:glycosyltransferase involved in cell wall biosynthesis